MSHSVKVTEQYKYHTMSTHCGVNTYKAIFMAKNNYKKSAI